MPPIFSRYFLEYLGGAQDDPPPGAPRLLHSNFGLGLWWGILLLIILAFGGQTSKFIYIDF